MKIGSAIFHHNLLAKAEQSAIENPEKRPESKERDGLVKAQMHPVKCYACKAPDDHDIYTRKGLPKRKPAEPVAEEAIKRERPNRKEVYSSKLKSYMHEHPETRKVLQDFHQWRGPHKSSLEEARPTLEEFKKYLSDNSGVEKIVQEHPSFFKRYFERFNWIA